MPRGGARNRSGPQADPNSGRSDKRGFSLSALPSGGYDGKIPEWPLAPRSIMRWEFEDKRRYQVIDESATEQAARRELELWAWAWRTPQAAAWAVESWRWPTVAMWVRTYAICESFDSTAADKGVLPRYQDQIGLTPAGLKENGWAIAHDEVSPQREKRSSEPAPPPARRLRAVNDVE